MPSKKYGILVKYLLKIKTNLSAFLNKLSSPYFDVWIFFQNMKYLVNKLSECVRIVWKFKKIYSYEFGGHPSSRGDHRTTVVCYLRKILCFFPEYANADQYLFKIITIYIYTYG